MLVHDRPLIHRDDRFWSRRAVAQCAVWSDCVVVLPPLLGDDLCLFQGVEDLAIQQFVPEASIEAFTVSVLPRRAGFNVGGFGTDSMVFSP